MDTGLYVGLSSHIALERRLNTIANNVANSNTTGFRASKIRFSEVLSGVSEESPSFVSQGKNYLAPQAGRLTQTGSSLDFAVKGNVWFSAETPAGTIVTRDGRFQMEHSGELVTIEGHAVLDSGGAPVILDPAGGKPSVSADGVISQNGSPISSIGLFEYEPTVDFRRFGSSGIIAESTPQPVLNNPSAGVVQGSLEESNVNPVHEMSKLITIHRTFDNIAAAIREGENSLEAAIKALGSGR